VQVRASDVSRVVSRINGRYLEVLTEGLSHGIFVQSRLSPSRQHKPWVEATDNKSGVLFDIETMSIINV
jgi:hypothetical protein